MRLYQKIYLTILATLVVVVLVTGMLWRFGAAPPGHEAFQFAGELAQGLLPPADAARADQARAVDDIAQRLKIGLALYGVDGTVIAASGRGPAPPLPPGRPPSGFMRGPGGPAWLIALPDGRSLMARAGPQINHPALALILLLALVALAVAITAYPVVRGLTRRIERLQRGVETLGRGDLAARVEVSGRDEVARLASAFNASAERIQELVGAHRMLLAQASHELRTPLSRLRMGLELVTDKVEPRHKAEIESNIAELDRLVGEILLSSRLDAVGEPERRERVDLLALVAEECARVAGCDLDGTPVTVPGDAGLLRRLVRNLLENAERHGRPPVQVMLALSGGEAVLTVYDAGDGVPEAERERIFEPFRRLSGSTQSTGFGLGLALVRQIARRHGGKALVVPGPFGRGAFEVRLPVG